MKERRQANFETDDPIRIRFRKAELLDRITEIVKPCIDGAEYGQCIHDRYWQIRELIFPDIPQEILV